MVRGSYKECLMRSLNGILSGRVKSIRRRVVTSSAARGKGGRSSGRSSGPSSGRSSHPGTKSLSEKLARASEQVRGARHGRRT